MSGDTVSTPRLAAVLGMRQTLLKVPYCVKKLVARSLDVCKGTVLIGKGCEYLGLKDVREVAH